MKGEFYHEGKLFKFRENFKTVRIERKVYTIDIEGEDKIYTKKNLKRLREIVKLYYLKKGDV